MKLTAEQFCQMTDYTLLSPKISSDELEFFLSSAKEYHFYCTYMYPCFIPREVQAYQGTDVRIGGAVSFPYGAETTDTKIHQVREFIALGADELDLVMNINLFKLGKYDAVLDELKKLVAIADGKVLKVIIEASYLSNDEIKRASELVAASGASFVKTATGTTGVPTTLEQVKLIHETVGDACGVKASGGIRSLAQVCEMIEAGVTRFGISRDSALSILGEIQKEQ